MGYSDRKLSAATDIDKRAFVDLRTKSAATRPPISDHFKRRLVGVIRWLEGRSKQSELALSSKAKDPGRLALKGLW